MGLGFCPGESCVISSFRILPTSINKNNFQQQDDLISIA
jgi:hypothetical protein